MIWKVEPRLLSLRIRGRVYCKTTKVAEINVEKGNIMACFDQHIKKKIQVKKSVASSELRNFCKSYPAITLYSVRWSRGLEMPHSISIAPMMWTRYRMFFRTCWSTAGKTSSRNIPLHSNPALFSKTCYLELWISMSSLMDYISLFNVSWNWCNYTVTKINFIHILIAGYVI